MVYFSERQRFRQPWLWALTLPSMAGTVGLLWYGMYQQLFLGRPWGNQPTGDTALIVMGVATSLLCLGILWLLWASELRVELRDDSLHVRFFPFLRRSIPYARILRAEACAYSPIAEYGGWGVRYGRGGKAYNVSGNRGVRLEIEGGERLLIGSQRPEELARSLCDRIGR